MVLTTVSFAATMIDNPKDSFLKKLLSVPMVIFIVVTGLLLFGVIKTPLTMDYVGLLIAISGVKVGKGLIGIAKNNLNELKLLAGNLNVNSNKSGGSDEL